MKMRSTRKNAINVVVIFGAAKIFGATIFLIYDTGNIFYFFIMTNLDGTFLCKKRHLQTAVASCSQSRYLRLCYVCGMLRFIPPQDIEYREYVHFYELK